MKLRLMDKTFVCLTGLAVLIILALLFMIIANIVGNGWTRISWEFLSGDPREGMTKGGIFPAIFGTTLLVLLMTIFVVSRGSRRHLFLGVRRSGLHALSLVTLCSG
jgi:phosphate transport system permease protein